LEVKNHWFRSMIFNQGASLNSQAGTSSDMLYNVESLINEFTNKYICFYNLFNVKGFDTKDNYLRGLLERVNRTTVLDVAMTTCVDAST